MPLGAWIIRHVDAETFRRVCMSFDAWVVGFGISSLLQALRIVESNAAYTAMAVVVAVDLVLLYRFFSRPRASDLGPTPAGRQFRNAYVDHDAR